MQIKREEDNPLFTMITVKPWEEAWAAYITVLQERRDTQTGEAINRVRVNYGGAPLPVEVARRWANAILSACDIADQLEKEGRIILEGEEIAA